MLNSVNSYFLLLFRLIKEFDREIKDEEAKNPPEVNKQLNDEKQSMVSHLSSFLEGYDSNQSLYKFTIQECMYLSLWLIILGQEGHRIIDCVTT